MNPSIKGPTLTAADILAAMANMPAAAEPPLSIVESEALTIPGTPYEQRRTWKERLFSRLGCWCHPKPCHGHVLATLADALHFHGSPCPACTQPLSSSPMFTNEPQHVTEYWRCAACRAYGFQPRGRLQLLPEMPAAEPTLALE